MGVAITQIDLRETLSRFCKANFALGSPGYGSGIAGCRLESSGDGDSGLWAKERLAAGGLSRSWGRKPSKIGQGLGAKGLHEGAIVNVATTSLHKCGLEN